MQLKAWVPSVHQLDIKYTTTKPWIHEVRKICRYDCFVAKEKAKQSGSMHANIMDVGGAREEIGMKDNK